LDETTVAADRSCHELDCPKRVGNAILVRQIPSPRRVKSKSPIELGSPTSKSLFVHGCLLTVSLAPDDRLRRILQKSGIGLRQTTE
jgi:hypothetical protein